MLRYNMGRGSKRKTYKRKTYKRKTYKKSNVKEINKKRKSKKRKLIGGAATAPAEREAIFAENPDPQPIPVTAAERERKKTNRKKQKQLSKCWKLCKQRHPQRARAEQRKDLEDCFKKCKRDTPLYPVEEGEDPLAERGGSLAAEGEEPSGETLPPPGTQLKVARDSLPGDEPDDPWVSSGLAAEGVSPRLKPNGGRSAAASFSASRGSLHEDPKD